MSGISSPPTPTSPAPATKAKTGVDKAQTWITLLSTTAGVIGAVGTGAVWLIANFYTGTVEVKPDKPVESVVVKVYDSHGKENTFHSKTVQLMPGTYHMEVVLPNGRTRHYDASVKFGETTALNVSTEVAPSQDTTTGNEPGKKKRWFQFWRKSDKKPQEGGSL